MSKKIESNYEPGTVGYSIDEYYQALKRNHLRAVAIVFLGKLRILLSFENMLEMHLVTCLTEELDIIIAAYNQFAADLDVDLRIQSDELNRELLEDDKEKHETEQ